MPLTDDGDIVRGLGYVTLYAAWIEEDVDDLLRLMEPVFPFDEKRQRWQISKKIKHAVKLVRQINSDDLSDLLDALQGAIELFEHRGQFYWAANF